MTEARRFLFDASEPTSEELKDRFVPNVTTGSRMSAGRFAPSPTGAQHWANARTYLLAYWSARKADAKLVSVHRGCRLASRQTMGLATGHR